MAEVATALEGDLFVNIQGDEPMVDPLGIDAVISAAFEFPEISVFNGYSNLVDESQIHDRNTVKVISDLDGNALAFSRLPIPYSKEESVGHWRQLGLYGVRKSALLDFPDLKRGPLERSEGVEMYRFIENGIPVKMIKVEEVRSVAVDIPEDIPKVERLLKAGKYYE